MRQPKQSAPSIRRLESSRTTSASRESRGLLFPTGYNRPGQPTYLKTTLSLKISMDMECPVCFDECAEKQVIATPCGHLYCKSVLTVRRQHCNECRDIKP
ncbi:hypothetical protein BDQ17DRAFT_149964 [Cyathus striatus]|nr:hypothetical protein BDQ17DRAFT_149964 [Cyathus striatus]